MKLSDEKKNNLFKIKYNRSKYNRKKICET